MSAMFFSWSRLGIPAEPNEENGSGWPDDGDDDEEEVDGLGLDPGNCSHEGGTENLGGREPFPSDENDRLPNNVEAQGVTASNETLGAWRIKLAGEQALKDSPRSIFFRSLLCLVVSNESPVNVRCHPTHSLPPIMRAFCLRVCLLYLSCI
jgi:hypothetical protein